jgi:hypothetical protein
MAYTEDQILYETDVFTIICEGGVHKVHVSDLTHAVYISNFHGTPDGLSCAKAWVDYVVKHYSVESIVHLSCVYSSTILAFRRRQAEREQGQWSISTIPSDSATATAAA